MANHISVSIYGKQFFVPCKYKAGDVITASEAEELNRQLSRYVHNNISQQMRKNASSAAPVEITQEMLEEYTRNYQFGSNKIHTRKVVSPIEVVERQIAEAAVTAKLKERGISRQRIHERDFNVIVGGLISRGTFRKEAEDQVENAGKSLDIDLAAGEIEWERS